MRQSSRQLYSTAYDVTKRYRIIVQSIHTPPPALHTKRLEYSGQLGSPLQSSDGVCAAIAQAQCASVYKLVAVAVAVAAG
jgi:hypothetical protein